MNEVKILITPNQIKIAASKAAEYIRKLDFEALFLNFTKDLEEAIQELIKGAPYEYIVKRMQELKLISEPIGAWEYPVEPILKAIRGIYWKKPNLRVCCYK
ncbi:MAG: hypothetical protein ACK4TI_05460, partial [Nitrososphaerales archaeon]